MTERELKLHKGLPKWQELLKKYNIEIIYRNGSVMCFSIEENKYWYGIPSGQIRKEGNKNWTLQVLKTLNKDFNNNIPLRTIDINAYNSTYITFGIHRGYKWSFIKKYYSGYIDWLLENTKDEKLKLILEKL